MFRDHQKHIRQKVILRDQSLCVFCDRLLLPNEITLDHILPASQGGSFHCTNLTVACFKCNSDRNTTSFLDYLIRRGATPTKLEKYAQLSSDYLRIRILNAAKEQLVNYYEVPQVAIEKACHWLKTDITSFSGDDFSFHTLHRKRDIISHFNHLIHLIEKE